MITNFLQHVHDIFRYGVVHTSVSSSIASPGPWSRSRLGKPSGSSRDIGRGSCRSAAECGAGAVRGRTDIAIDAAFVGETQLPICCQLKVVGRTPTRPTAERESDFTRAACLHKLSPLLVLVVQTRAEQPDMTMVFVAVRLEFCCYSCSGCSFGGAFRRHERRN